MTRQEIITLIDRGEIIGSRTALGRVHRSNVCLFLGANQLGDQVYNLGRLPREHIAKRLYLHEFNRPNAAGARFRAYVAAEP